MKKLLFTLALMFVSLQAAEATLTFDTLWHRINYTMKCKGACFAVDTTKILTAMDYSIYYLDLLTGDIIDSLEKAPALIDDASLSISSNGSRIAAILENGNAVIWNDSTKQIIKTFKYDTINKIHNVSACALSPDGRYIVCGTSSTFIDYHGFQQDHMNMLIYDLNLDTIVKWMDSLYIKDVEDISSILFSPDGNYFLVASAGAYNNSGILTRCNLTKYSVNGWQVNKILEKNNDSLYVYLKYSMDGKYLGAIKDLSCKVWDMNADTIYKYFTFQKINNWYDFINFSSDNNYLLFGGGFNFINSKRTQIWDFVNDTSIFQSEIYSAVGIDFSINGKYLLLADRYEIYLLTPNWNKTSIAEANANNENALQILPNPASNVITITFNLQNAGNARLSLFNQLGQEIAMLKNEWEESGKHDFRFTVSDFRLNAGVYFVQLQTGSEVGYQKLLITN